MIGNMNQQPETIELVSDPHDQLDGIAGNQAALAKLPPHCRLQYADVHWARIAGDIEAITKLVFAWRDA